MILEPVKKLSCVPKKCFVDLAFHHMCWSLTVVFLFFFYFLAFLYSCSHLECWGGVQPNIWRLNPAEFSNGAEFSQSCQFSCWGECSITRPVQSSERYTHILSFTNFVVVTHHLTAFSLDWPFGRCYSKYWRICFGIYHPRRCLRRWNIGKGWSSCDTVLPRKPFSWESMVHESVCPADRPGVECRRFLSMATLVALGYKAYLVWVW